MESERFYAIGHGNRVLMPKVARQYLPINGDGWSYILVCEGGKVIAVHGPIENFMVTTIVKELNVALLLEHKEISDATIYGEAVENMKRDFGGEYNHLIPQYTQVVEEAKFEAKRYRERHDGRLSEYPPITRPQYLGKATVNSYFPGLAGV